LFFPTMVFKDEEAEMEMEMDEAVAAMGIVV